jgi:hypothetical protein
MSWISFQPFSNCYKRTGRHWEEIMRMFATFVGTASERISVSLLYGKVWQACVSSAVHIIDCTGQKGTDRQVKRRKEKRTVRILRHWEITLNFFREKNRVSPCQPPVNPLGATVSARLLIPWASGENGLRIGYFIFVKSRPNEPSIENERERERESSTVVTKSFTSRCEK